MESERKEAGTVEFYVDLAEIGPICPEFQKFEGVCDEFNGKININLFFQQTYVEIATNCRETKILAPKEFAEISTDQCSHAFNASLNPKHFHAFLEAVCPSLYGIRPVPITSGTFFLKLKKKIFLSNFIFKLKKANSIEKSIKNRKKNFCKKLRKQNFFSLFFFKIFSQKMTINFPEKIFFCVIKI